MANRPTAATKQLIRAGNRSGTSTGAARATTPGVVVCEGCGAVWTRRTWRRDRPPSAARLGRARWALCPACEQRRSGTAYGRVLLRGAYVRRHDEEIRRRIANVATRAAHTQPQRRLVSVEDDGEGLEVLTTSQKLAHRIVHELTKAFRGRARYQWADRDGALFATWRRER